LFRPARQQFEQGMTVGEQEYRQSRAGQFMPEELDVSRMTGNIAGTLLPSTAAVRALKLAQAPVRAGAVGGVVSGTNFADGWSFASVASAQTRTFARSFTFQSADQARYFFNGGGRLRINVTASDNTAGGSQRSAAMASLIQAIGSCDIDANGARNLGFTGTGVTSGEFGLANVCCATTCL
jgi:hypothetical protein